MPWEPGSPTVQAVLCDYADEANGKLTMVGAGTTELLCRARPPHLIFGALALVIRVPAAPIRQEHRVTVELRAGSGRPTGADGGTSQRVPINVREQTWLPPEDRGIATLRFVLGGSPDAVEKEEVLTTVVSLQGRQVPQPGSYSFTVTLNGETVDLLPFRVLPPADAAAG